MAKLVLRPYATALFEIAEEQNAIKEFSEQVNRVITGIEQNDEFMELLLHPKLALNEKVQLIESVFKDKVADEITGILTIITQKGRQNILIDILKEFLEMVSKHLGIVKATVTSAVELNNQQLEQIKNQIQSTTDKSVELHAGVDKALIGGMIIRVGDNVVDASIAGRIKELKEGLTNLRLA